MMCHYCGELTELNSEGLCEACEVLRDLELEPQDLPTAHAKPEGIWLNQQERIIND